MLSSLTVTTAANTYNLTTLATVKAELGITDQTQDANIAIWIQHASGVVASYCNRVFGQETVVETFRLHGGCGITPERLVLRRLPVSSVTSVVEDGDTLTSDDYELDSEKGWLLRLDGSDNPSFWSRSKIVITYVAGYALLDSLPFAIEQACIELVKSRFHNSSRDPLAKRIKVEGVDETEWWVGGVAGSSGALPPNVIDLLAPFRNNIVA